MKNGSIANDFIASAKADISHNTLRNCQSYNKPIAQFG